MANKIAVEEHYVTTDLDDTLFPNIGWDQAEWDAVQARLHETDEVRLEDMDRNGIELAVLSLAAPCIQGVSDERRAVDRARRANDALAHIVAAHPERYAGIAALPMQTSDGAASELERCVRDLGFKGALVNGYSDIGREGELAYYDEPQYRPFWEAVAELDVPFYLHPRNPPGDQQRMYRGREELLGPTWAFAVETATHALRLITSGLFDRLPSLNIVLGHLGELLPFAVDRLGQRLAHVTSVSLERPATEYLRRNFYLTTSGNFHTPSLLGAIQEVGADRILFAVDYPFEKSDDAVEWFDDAPISAADRRAISRENAARVFRL